ncbi:MAG: hypothetical protein NC112_01175, partial [Oxalobacter formigenes]|nr:hypothetical protein [Oxalobacter formigenes]
MRLASIRISKPFWKNKVSRCTKEKRTAKAVRFCSGFYRERLPEGNPFRRPQVDQNLWVIPIWKAVTLSRS